ncbi:hypothetical protein TVAG_292740 [Trichomonas vaginalis G3]|uniref:DNA/RNA-binding protein Kin17 WH-like domain-containing protein n=1 Tax=Trichomonas vaginalis (strain ATCC PRA-98 / G3) TaxID=412133 RepID=A2F0E6_TRIV3|nr:DNA replication [Trichomonas vaginalis G3]EAY01641.1 hypothetical protein TVAG_292740 [Trichomonas vaginalis G3]KAI5551606.1 DNA replication [Trichomonas vaginalis G3]|eukprot:XP_001330373.1 hypothetical protein [Trichomonas vaginalis G3]
MGKKDLSEAKRISKHLKHGGLGKLKLFCDVCKFQARDPEAFRAHTQTEHHRLMMARFRQSEKATIDANSMKFQKEFLQVLKTRFPNKEVNANIVYMQTISDRNHQHMNSTRWESVRGFLTEMQRLGYLTVRTTEQGRFIKYIEVDPALQIAEKIKTQVEEQFNKDLENTRSSIEEQMKSAPAVVFEDTVKAPQSVNVSFATEEKPVQKKVSSLFGGSNKPKPPPKPPMKL